jgi:hypothetical protein
MSDEPVFPIAIRDSDPGATDPPTPPPLVVIQYRSRLFPAILLPPAFILLAAAFIVGYRVRIADWPGLWPLRFDHQTTAVGSVPTPKKLPAPASPATQIVLRVQNSPLDAQESGHAGTVASTLTQTQTAASEKVKAAAGARRAASADLPQESAGVATGRASAVADTDPGSPDLKADLAEVSGASLPVVIDAASAPVPSAPLIRFETPDASPLVADAVQAPEAVVDPPTKEQVWGDIERQAAQQKEDRQRLEKMKPIWLEQDRLEAQRRLQMQIAEALKQADEDRPRFLAELKRLLDQRGNRSYTEIEDLCLRYGRDTMAQIDEKVHQVLASTAARLGRNQRVNLLRYYGLPETRILDYLYNAESKNITKRNGPRNQEEALMRAARQLLAVPLPPPPQAQPRAPAQQYPKPSASAGAPAPISKAASQSGSAQVRRR